MLTMKNVLPTEADTVFFEENGYWIAPKLISDTRLETLKQHMELIHQQQFETGHAPWEGYWKPDSGERLRKTDNSHWADLTLRSLATDPLIGEIAARLMRTNTIGLWHDQLLYKPGRMPQEEELQTANVGWHQDYWYWQCAARPSLLTAWVAFDDVNVANGCMQIVRGSNHWGLLDTNNFFEQDIQRQEASMQLPAEARFETVPLVMQAGQVSFHHCMTLHGSGPNNTPNPRRSLAVHLMTGNTRYRAGTPGDTHMNTQLLKPADGDLFVGEGFPTLYQA